MVAKARKARRRAGLIVTHPMEREATSLAVDPLEKRERNTRRERRNRREDRELRQREEGEREREERGSEREERVLSVIASAGVRVRNRHLTKFGKDEVRFMITSRLSCQISPYLFFLYST